MTALDKMQLKIEAKLATVPFSAQQKLDQLEKPLSFHKESNDISI